MSESRRDESRGSEAPQSRSKVSAKRRRERAPQLHDLQRFLADFKSGLGRLKVLTQRLVERRTHDKALPSQSTVRIERRTQHEILRTLERELRLVERTAPPEIRDRVVREFRSKAETAIQMGIPQTYAKLIDAAAVKFGSVTPAKALRPNQTPTVKALLSAVRAIRSGRLAFLPRETRMEARKLLRGIFGSPKAGNTPSKPQIAKIVQSQRLLPLVVQGMMRAYEKPEQYEPYVKAVGYAKDHYFLPELPETPAAVGGAAPPAPDAVQASPIAGVGPIPRARAVPLTARDIPRLAKAIPAFQTTGAAHAYMYEPNEDVHVITRNDGLMTAATPPTGEKSGPVGTPGATPRRESARIPSMSAPTARSNNTASAADRSASTLGVTDKPLVASGTLRIDGLPQFIANTEMRLSGLESRARRQDG